MPMGNVSDPRLDAQVGQRLRQIAGVRLGLRAHELVGAERLQQPLRLRQRLEQRRRRERDVQEEAEPNLFDACPQQLAQRDQVVIVHPDKIARPQQRRQRIGEQLRSPPCRRRSPPG